MGKNNGAANLLVGVTGVNAETNVKLNCLVKFCLGSANYDIKSICRLVKICFFNELCAFFIIFSSNIVYASSTVMPMLRAVPAIMLIAASRLPAFRSFIFVSAIF